VKTWEFRKIASHLDWMVPNSGVIGIIYTQEENDKNILNTSIFSETKLGNEEAIGQIKPHEIPVKD
jgi:hypothetical protein